MFKVGDRIAIQSEMQGIKELNGQQATITQAAPISAYVALDRGGSAFLYNAEMRLLPIDDSNYITTVSGKRINLAAPTVDDIVITDIAHALGNICRFNGQIKRFYSVAQHSMYVAQLCPPEQKLAGLLHDAAEAYLCDIPTPIKRVLGAAYRELEERFAAVIGQKFGVDLVNLHESVKLADRMMLVSERDALYTNPVSWGPDYDNVVRYPNFRPSLLTNASASDLFMNAFTEYSNTQPK